MKESFPGNSILRKIYYKSSRLIFVLKRKVKSARSLNHNEDQKLVFGLSKKRFPSLKQLKQLKYFLSDQEKKIIFLSLIVLIISFSWLSINFVWNRLVEVPKY